jgi:hypothetical protein
MPNSIKMLTHIQTVEITMAGSTNVILSLEKYPVCPVEVPLHEPLYLDDPNGDVYTWYPYGSASIRSKDGTFRVFWKKPTMRDVVLNDLGHYASYVRFFKDGSVEDKRDNQCYWWGPTITGEPVIGSTFQLCRFCTEKNCYSDDCSGYDSC